VGETEKGIATADGDLHQPHLKSLWEGTATKILGEGAVEASRRRPSFTCVTGKSLGGTAAIPMDQKEAVLMPLKGYPLAGNYRTLLDNPDGAGTKKKGRKKSQYASGARTEIDKHRKGHTHLSNHRLAKARGKRRTGPTIDRFTSHPDPRGLSFST